MLDRQQVFANVRSALQSAIDDPALEVRPEDRLVDDLGFDSTSIASLTIALEDVFDDVLLLNDWITSSSSPSELTVGSLVDYLTSLLSEPS
jgi:acyl carrier protein